MNPIATAARGKGVWKMVKRSTAIGRRYGLTSRKMDRLLARFAAILETFDGKATFPITGAALARSNGFTRQHEGPRIEFAAHGYYHVDHVQLSLVDQVDHFTAVSRLFAHRGMVPAGFRCPYLRWSDDTIAALRQASFLYDSSQAVAWDVLNGVTSAAYRRVLQFYGAQSAADYPALPRWDQGLVRIPYCLPDDEALIDRLVFPSAGAMNQVWPAMLAETHRLGELFTLGLHPERLDLCETALVETLRQARSLSPGVWLARLDEIAHWWQARTNTRVAITGGDGGSIQVNVSGPAGVTVLARGVEVAAESHAWDGAYRRVRGLDFSLPAGKRPFIALSPDSAPYLASFLQQQGYIIEWTASGRDHTVYLDRARFEYEDERPLLHQLEQGQFPLVRLGRWPNGARSALCVTGDIDALTIWDYALRFLGH